jgi:hypothetical protein
MKMAVFWVVAPCSLIEVYRRVTDACCLHHQDSKHLWNVGKFLLDNTVQQPRRQPSSRKVFLSECRSRFGAPFSPVPWGTAQIAHRLEETTWEGSIKTDFGDVDSEVFRPTGFVWLKIRSTGERWFLGQSLSLSHILIKRVTFAFPKCETHLFLKKYSAHGPK